MNFDVIGCGVVFEWRFIYSGILISLHLMGDLLFDL